MAKDSEPDDVSEDGSDVLDTVTQLDDETEFSALSSSETKQVERVKPAQRQQLSPNGEQKELEATQEMVQLLRKGKKNLVDRLQVQAQRQLKKGGKFEDLSAGECRPSALVERYENLYTQTRLDAMDELDELESLDKVDDSGDIKKKILFSVLVVAYRTVQHSLTEKQTKLKKILDIPDDDKIAAHAEEMQDRIADYLRITGARLKIDSIKQDVSKQLWSTLYDFPELQNCVKLKEYMDECVRLSWMLAVQVPPMSIEHEATEFSEKLHGRFMTSNMTSLEIKYHVWPALIESKAGVVLYRGTVVT
ncbi:unnamed protein product [Porites lobata]|uniref:Mitochondria-eating protein n=1 Tax=Porites lobata TaxID=104759 RepID=A0ABN8PHJ5_9CNID|nr:unnamed protein product [Porites lobata]